jgi:hypothetical protein
MQFGIVVVGERQIAGEVGTVPAGQPGNLETD